MAEHVAGMRWFCRSGFLANGTTWFAEWLSNAAALVLWTFFVRTAGLIERFTGEDSAGMRFFTVQRWSELAGSIGMRGNTDEIFGELARRYGEAHRHYHNATESRSGLDVTDDP